MKSLCFDNKYKNALIVGTGGGNDIVSATLIADYLSNNGINCDVAGILSPGAVHEFNGKFEEPVNQLKGDVRRYISSKNRREISFLDTMLPQLSKKLGYKINRFYDFSTRFGTNVLEKEIYRLIKQNGYDLFLEVDVGGDIIGRKKDKTLLSPLMDFTSLYLLDKVPIDSYLIEFGLGTDGELRKDGIFEILDEFRSEKVLLSEHEIDNSHNEIKRFKNLFSEIAAVRAGNTALMTFKTLDHKNSNQDIKSIYYSKWRIGNCKWKNYFEVVLPHETFGKVYIIDGKRLPGLRKETAVSYENLIEQFVKVKSVPQWKTELDLCYIDDFDGVYFLTPSLNVPENIRKEIVLEGLLELNRSNAQKVIILDHDKKYLSKKYNSLNADNLRVVSINKDIDLLTQNILQYSKNLAKNDNIEK